MINSLFSRKYKMDFKKFITENISPVIMSLQKYSRRK